MNSHHIHTCTMPIPLDCLHQYMSPLPEVYIGYQLWYNKKVVVIRLQLDPGVGKNIKDWDRLEKDVQLAAENNSKSKIVPGQERSRRVDTDPQKVLEREQHASIKL